MRLPFDQNLSYRLVRALADIYPGSHHVRDVGLESADDAAVWEYAIQHHFIIVSKDSDLHQLSFMLGPPPKVIWIRRGNCSTEQIESILRSSRAPISAFDQDSVTAFLALG